MGNPNNTTRPVASQRLAQTPPRCVQEEPPTTTGPVTEGAPTTVQPSPPVAPGQRPDERRLHEGRPSFGFGLGFQLSGIGYTPESSFNFPLYAEICAGRRVYATHTTDSGAFNGRGWSLCARTLGTIPDRLGGSLRFNIDVAALNDSIFIRAGGMVQAGVDNGQPEAALGVLITLNMRLSGRLAFQAGITPSLHARAQGTDPFNFRDFTLEIPVNAGLAAEW